MNDEIIIFLNSIFLIITIDKWLSLVNLQIIYFLCQTIKQIAQNLKQEEEFV